jgi:hypothetical protein
MIIGNTAFWLDRLKSAEDIIVERISYIWPECLLNISKEDSENKINNTLASFLRKDKTARSIGLIIPQYPVLEMEPREEHIKGFIDIAVVLDSNEHTYIAFEGKRLNVHNPDRHSLAGKYVEDGICRYVYEKYAEHLPFGAMLGYVVDGDWEFAFNQICNAVKERIEIVRQVSNQELLLLPSVCRFTRFSTYHLRACGTSIEVRHSLLPLPRLS